VAVRYIGRQTSYDLDIVCNNLYTQKKTEISRIHYLFSSLNVWNYKTDVNTLCVNTEGHKEQPESQLGHRRVQICHMVWQRNVIFVQLYNSVNTIIPV